jgi:lactate racemase
MSQSISLPYGDTSTTILCRSGADLYRVDDPVQRIDPIGFAKRLKTAIPREGLDLSRPAVVVADKTRLCAYPQYLPVLLDTMTELGADPGAITLYIAYGTHMGQSHEACQKAYGSAYRAYRWIHHNCDEGPFVRLGETRRGTPVHLRQDLAGASCIITFGAISHHYFAGYGGGRKLIFPGLGKRENIYANHSLFLYRESRSLADGCRSGRLDDNPLAEDLAEVETFRPADLAIHGILNSRGEVCDLMVGQGPDQFRRACARHAQGCEVAVKRRYDLVVAACGGFPKDINLIQSHKAIHHAADFVRDGGRLIVLAQCRDGIGSDTFLPWFEPGGWDAAFDALSCQYVGNGGTALAMMAKCRRINISLVTELDAETVHRIGCDLMSPAEVQAFIDHHSGGLAVIPNASLTVGKARRSSNPIVA